MSFFKYWTNGAKINYLKINFIAKNKILINLTRSHKNSEIKPTSVNMELGSMTL
jgi:hypothetical protein